MASPFSWLVQSVGRLWSWTKRAFSSNRDQDRRSVMSVTDNWGRLSSRMQRYHYWWAFYEATIYDDIHSFFQTNKVQLGLYEDIDPIGNPVAEINNFWHYHIWGGALDDEAGDGRAKPSAIPIETKNNDIRAPIAQLWRHSNWQIEKDVATLQGNVKGDVGIAIVDDVQKGRVCLQVIDPCEILDYTPDLYGNCRSYVLECAMPDPRWRVTDDAPQTQVRYREICWRGEGNDVHFQTWLDDQLYPWNGKEAEWTEQYGFVPFVLIPNIKLLPKSPFGAPECHTGRHKFHALDDIASMTRDNISKLNDPMFVMAGMRDPAENRMPRDDADDEEYGDETNNPSSRKKVRDKQQFVWTTEPNARPHAVVASTNISHVTGVFMAQYELVKRAYPELRLDHEFASGDASGRALRVSRARLERKGETRRATWDDGLVRAQKMALSIGGMKGYDGYESIDEGSYERGDLDHTIGHRSLFQTDPEDVIDLKIKQAELHDKRALAGIPVLASLAMEGESEAMIRMIGSAQDDAMRRGMAVGRSKQQAQGSAGTAGTNNGQAQGGGQKQLGA